MRAPSEGGTPMRVFATLGSAAVFAAVLLSPVRAQPKRFGDLHRMLPWDGGFGSAVALGDVDGDGDLDALLGNSQFLLVPTQNRLYLNDGLGVLTDGTSQLPPGNANSVTLGDVDGDGDLDAVTSSHLYVNDGSGLFADGSAKVPSGFGGLAMGDVEEDGDLDVVAPGQLYVNDGSGTFSDASSQFPSGSGTSLALGDVDGDGDLDALVGTMGLFLPVQDRLLLNDGSGVFTDTSAQLPAISDSTLAVALGDVDGDGDLDALTGNQDLFLGGYPQQNRLSLNDGSGVFTDATPQLPALLDSTRDVAFGDVDGDGDLDAWIGNGAYKGIGDQDHLHLNDGSGVFTDATAQLPAVLDFTRAVALGDLDGDGDLDALVANSWGSATLRAEDTLYLNDGSGVFTDASARFGANAGVTVSVALGDVDGDGDLDAVLARPVYAGGPEVLYVNDGSGAFAEAPGQVPAVAGFARALALGDVDADGDLDAVVGDYSEDRLYLNDGSGVFALATGQIPAILDFTRAVALGDVDGDGDLDALIGNDGQQSRLYLNDGFGSFADGTAQVPAFVGNTRALALGDVDGDADLDVLIGNSGQQDRLYFNDGSGFFTNATAQLPAIVGFTSDLAFGDVDGDGDRDAMLASSSQQTRLYANGGSGLFSDATGQLPPAAAWHLALGDADGDGDLDALLGGDYPPTQLFLNDGSGGFTDSPGDLPAGRLTWEVVLGDLDGDGDLDAWLGTEGRDRVLSNLTRQLAWRGIPRIGKPLTFDLYGPGWGAFFFGFSFGTANVPIPPLGTLRLDPSGMIFLIGGLLDADGRASLTYPVPANPAVVGASLYWQALVVGPARFTNLEITTLTNL